MLDPAFLDKLHTLLTACSDQGVEMRPYFGIRTPVEQAKLWRQSRTSEQVKAKIAELKAGGAPYLAACIEKAGPQSGPPVTNAIPGLSWHQWGEAVDAAWIIDGKTEWSTQKKIDGINGYAVYAAQAQIQGLNSGGLWRSLKDWPHVQLRSAGSPLKIMSLAEVDQTMQAKFG